jgi:hypothetical protein
VDGAGPDDDEEALLGVGAGDDGYGLLAALVDRLLGVGRLGDLMLEEVGRGEGVVAADCKKKWRRELVRDLTKCVSLSGVGGGGVNQVFSLSFCLLRLTPPVLALGLVADVFILNEELSSRISYRVSPGGSTRRGRK